MPNAKQNIISGFRKTGIIPLKDEVLNLLPKETLQPQEAEAINTSIIDLLKEMRYSDKPTRKSKNKKLTVVAGKSVKCDSSTSDSDDIASVNDNFSESDNSDNNTGQDDSSDDDLPFSHCNKENSKENDTNNIYENTKNMPSTSAQTSDNNFCIGDWLFDETKLINICKVKITQETAAMQDKVYVRNPHKLTEAELNEFRDAIFREQEEQEVGGSDDDSASDKDICVSEHNTDSELDVEEFSDESVKVDLTYKEVLREPSFVGKDKKTIWRKHPVRPSMYRKQHHHNMIRSRLRFIGRLLITAKTLDQTVKDFANLPTPSKFDVMVEAIKSIGGINENSTSYRAPTTVLHLSIICKQACRIWKSECIKNCDANGKQNVDDFLSLFNATFPAALGRTALENRVEHQRQKIVEISTSADIKKLVWYLREQRRKWLSIVKGSKVTNLEYAVKQLASFTLVSLLVFNRRRPGELERITLKDFKSFRKNKLPSIATLCKELPYVEELKNRLPNSVKSWLQNELVKKQGNFEPLSSNSRNIRRTRWTPALKRILNIVFADHFDAGTLPSLPECLQAMENYKELQGFTAAASKTAVANKQRRRLREISKPCHQRILYRN
ncbi:hypothetical protein RN001_005796 [Aquatica leii]|uniref:Uncharacterized protein n=1 Tax=Aquatica leii TaxID=1421715 RepID=A0AAN7PCB6_9COLE|nr:hypothetical protein RN001_005796 [Aquatica leii]